MNYKHTQVGYLIIFVSLIIFIYFGILLTYANLNSIAITIMFLVILLLASFVSLNVIVDNDNLKIKFGYGLFRKRFLLKEITAVKIVKNHWYYGWGIRFWLWPRMTIYNVSGFDAVEIKMVNGKTYRIGTDDPKNLEATIRKAIR